MRTPNLHRAKNRSTKECGWKDGDRGGPAQTEKPSRRKTKNRLDTNRPSHGRSWQAGDIDRRLFELRETSLYNLKNKNLRNNWKDVNYSTELKMDYASFDSKKLPDEKVEIEFRVEEK